MEIIKIRSKLKEYIDDKIQYPDFRRWFAAEYSNQAEAGESEALRLSRAIEWELADYSEGLIQESELRNRLLPLTGIEQGESETRATSVAVTRVYVMGRQVSNVPVTSRNAHSFGMTMAEQIRALENKSGKP